MNKPKPAETTSQKPHPSSDGPILALNGKATCRALMIGRTTLWRLAKTGEIPFIEIETGAGRKIKRYPIAGIEAYLMKRSQ